MPSILRSRAPIVLSLCGSCVLRCRMLSCLPARHLAHRQKARSMCRDAVVSMYPRYLRHTLCAGAAIETPVLGGWSKANHMLLFRAVSRQAPAVSLAPAFRSSDSQMPSLPMGVLQKKRREMHGGCAHCQLPHIC